jgi:hypothetical protein
MKRPVATAVLLLAALTGVASLRAQLADAPSTRPAKFNTLAELESAALKAFESGDYAAALPLLKDLSVRLRNEPDRVGPLLEKVRVCEANLSQQAVIEGINAPRTPHQKPADGDVYELGLQKLGNFAYDAEKGGGIPEDVAALSGSTIRISGYMIPIDESDRISKFVLVPDLFACCFGQPPSLQHTVTVVCPPGKAVGYYPEPINVTGTLKVEEKRDEGFVISLFEVTATSVRPAVK